MKINHEWSQPLPLPFCKNIIIRIGEPYAWFSVKISGEDGVWYSRTVLGKDKEIMILGPVKDSVRSPVISFRTEFDTEVTNIDFEIKD